MTEKRPLPWERADDESADAWSAFQKYRDLPAAERSLSRLASEIAGKSANESPTKVRRPETIRNLLGRWSSIHHWQDRCREWDRELDRRATERHVDEVIEMRRQLAQEARALIVAGMQPAMELMQRVKDQNLVLADLSSADLFKLTIAFARVFPGIAQVEVQSRGDVRDGPVESVTPVAPEPFTMTDQQMIEYWAVMEQMGFAPHPPDGGGSLPATAEQPGGQPDQE